jgi:hypothetical protein
MPMKGKNACLKLKLHAEGHGIACLHSKEGYATLLTQMHTCTIQMHALDMLCNPMVA